MKNKLKRHINWMNSYYGVEWRLTSLNPYSFDYSNRLMYDTTSGIGFWINRKLYGDTSPVFHNYPWELIDTIRMINETEHYEDDDI